MAKARHLEQTALSSRPAIAIDGSTMEGGGQVLRNSVSLAALLNQPIIVNNIRANRKPTGLRAQHATGISLAADIAAASTTGLAAGSSSISFSPGPLELKDAYIADAKTAGSTTLLFQVALPCLLFKSNSLDDIDTLARHITKLTLRGGTNAAMAPQIDYTENIFFPFMQRHFGVNISLVTKKRGFFPQGGGEVKCTVNAIPGPLPAINLTERGCAMVGRLPQRMAAQMARVAARRLEDSGVCSSEHMVVRHFDCSSLDFGGGIIVWAETENGCILGGSALSATRADEPHDVGTNAANELLRNLHHGGCVDEHLQDQVIIFMALAEGLSKVRTGPLTEHTRTAMWVAEQITRARFMIKEDERGAIIECKGIGYTPAFRDRACDGDHNVEGEVGEVYSGGALPTLPEEYGSL